jgi:putative flippase GtrA
MSQISSMTHQIRRFSLVGISNTAVDFIATNVLFFALRPGSEAGLLLVSVVACLIATGNSYWLNSRWTFGEVAERDRSKARFLATAGVGMIVNTAVFLFLMRHLPFSGVSNEFVLLNLSRIGGVLAAMTLTFCGYRPSRHRRPGIPVRALRAAMPGRRFRPGRFSSSWRSHSRCGSCSSRSRR